MIRGWRTAKPIDMRRTKPLLNVKRSRDGARSFGSKGERDRGAELEIMQQAGLIRDLRYQVQFNFVHNGITVDTYKADFVYWDVKNQRQVVEDFKSNLISRDYLRHRKMMRAFYGINIYESGRRDRVRKWR